MATVEEDASSPTPPATESPAGESKTQREARLRRERRNAKIQAGGSARLNKIMASSGRPVAAEAELNKPSIPQAANATSSQRGSTRTRTDDPAEVDISQMFQKPQDDPTMQDPQDLFRQMLAASAPPNQQGATSDQQMPGADDPMMRMMQQMLGGGGPGGPGGAGEGLPPGLSAMFGGQPQQAPDNNADYLWRIVHAVLSLLLGLYAAFTFTFNGSELARASFSTDGFGPRFFWIFATAELVLQSSRYFLDQGKLPVSGILGNLGQMLPETYANYVRMISRYSIIYTTIVSDAMVILFVLGCMAWWHGMSP